MNKLEKIILILIVLLLNFIVIQLINTTARIERIENILLIEGE